MDTPNNYEEALQVYGNTLMHLAQAYPDAELILNASSGTPAIKVSCLLCVAEGRIIATPWYADDPTKTRRADPVRNFDVTFLRESALTQRACDLLQRGQFGLAHEPLTELSLQAYSPARKQWAGNRKRLASALQCWDERDYKMACGRAGKLLRDWKDAPADIRQALEHQHQVLEGLSRTVPPNGLLAWDLYFQASRLEAGGQLAGAIIYLWIAMETVIFEYAGRRYHIDTGAPHYSIQIAIRDLHANQSLLQTTLSLLVYSE